MNFFFRSAIIQKIKLIMLMLPILGVSCLPNVMVAANPDTTWSVSISLNMTKAVNQHIFAPDSDFVYIIIPGVDSMRLVAGQGYIYTGVLFDVLDSGVTYNYKFRINESLSETVTRQLTAKPGVVSINTWWNNEPLNVTTFVVNMEFEAQKGLFNPATDSVFITGTLNDLSGPAKMQQVGTTLNYTWAATLLSPGSVHQYKYRINANPGRYELLNKPDRMVRISDTLLTINNDFNNVNPAKLPMTFKCDLGYYVKAHHFSTTSDYLEVKGNFNQGAKDVLFDKDGDTIYTAELFIDTAWIHQGPLAFKFRIGGNQGSTELTGLPDRNYAFHDTINQNPNMFSCFYNNLNPAVATPPWAYNVSIQGLLIYKKFLSGIYAYENVNGIHEGVSTYRWLRSTNAMGTNAVAIDSATRITYVVDTLDIGKWLVFEVTPHASSGDSTVGVPVRVVTSNSISAWDVGFDENSFLISRVYPNPASNFITIEAKLEIDRIEMINLLNQTVLAMPDISSRSMTLNIGSLPCGVYLLKATTKTHQRGIIRVVKL